MMSQMAQALGKTADAATYGLLYTNICSAFQTNFVAADGTVGTGSQGGYALALAFNLLTPAQSVLASNKMAAAVNVLGGNPSVGMVTAHLLLPALTGIGRNDLAYQMLEKTNYPSWGFEVGVGATTIFELWNSVNADGTINISQDGMNSLNHANFGACAEWFYRDILGIDLLQPGFRKIMIAPQVGGGLTSAQGFYNSIQGGISNAWTYTNNVFSMTVTIPPNTTAQICVPTTNASAITESGLAATNSPGVSYVGISNGAAIYDVGSGSYVFSSPLIISAPPPPSNIVNNFSFEANVTPPGTSLNSVPAGWTAFNEVASDRIGSENAGGIDYTIFDPLATTADGNQFCWINMFTGDATGGIYQDVGALQPNTIYTLTVAIGSRADRINSPGIVSLVNGTDNTGVVVSTTNALPARQNTWQDYAITYNTGSTVNGDLTIMLSAAGAGTIQADFDNVRLAITPIIPPTLGIPKVAGSNLILTGTGGTANVGYTWLVTTNLSMPINWKTNNIGILNGSGAFSNTIPITPTQPASFYRLRIP
jgi:hypothetical protein